MPTRLIKRFGDWLGTWRGTCEFSDGRAGLMQFRLTSVFNGEAIQVDTASYIPESGAPMTRGSGFFSLDRQGRVVNNIYADYLGFAVLVETPDDPEVLSLEGGLPGNMTLTVTMSVANDLMTLSSRVGEGYKSAPGRPRTYTQMKRVGPIQRPKGDAP
ncbi:MAG: hypothetical protein KDB90_15100 [Planctomycetes bacterium]|nr:hypothetical protein [Planctomycetota bacterium]